jgi:hypothetical protein
MAKTIARMTDIHFMRLPSDGSTNVCRFLDSKPNGKQNLETISSMLNSGGWSHQHQAVVTPFNPWWFTPGSSRKPGYITAQDYLDHINVNRALHEITLRASGDIDKIEMFETLYCVKNADGSHTRYIVTLDDYSVHSGHQRAQYCVEQACLASIKARKAYESATMEARATMSVPVPFNPLIPCTVMEFESFAELQGDQMRANNNSGIHNDFTIIDVIMTCLGMLGNGVTKLIDESGFRKWFAIAGNVKEDGAAPGGTPRLAYLLAEICWYYGGRLKFFESITTSSKKEIAGQTVDNPDWIDVKLFTEQSKDPRFKPSVIARCMEPGLDKLRAYEYFYKEDGRKNAGKPTKLSAIEELILQRGFCWTEVEAQTFIDSLKPYGGKYTPPVGVVKVVDKTPQVIEAMKATAASTEVSITARKILAELTQSELVQVGAANLPAPVGFIDKISKTEFKGPIDGLTALNEGEESVKIFLSFVETVSVMWEGNHAAFERLVGSLGSLLADSLKPIIIVEPATAEGAAINGNGDVTTTTTPAEESVGETKSNKRKSAK